MRFFFLLLEAKFCSVQHKKIIFYECLALFSTLGILCLHCGRGVLVNCVLSLCFLEAQIVGGLICVVYRK